MSGNWRWRLEEQELRSITVLVIAHTLLLLTAMWAVWGQHPRSVRWAVAAAVGALVTVSQRALYGFVAAHPYSDPCPAAIWSQNALLFAVTFVSFLLLRRSRCELQRTIPVAGDVAVNRRTAFGLLVGVPLLVSFMISVYSDDSWAIRLAQASRLAVWFVLGRPAFVWRLPLVLALLFVVWLTGRLGDVFSLYLVAAEAMLAIQWLLVQIPLWIMQSMTGLRLSPTPLEA